MTFNKEVRVSTCTLKTIDLDNFSCPECGQKIELSEVIRREWSEDGEFTVFCENCRKLTTVEKKADEVELFTFDREPTRYVHNYY